MKTNLKMLIGGSASTGSSMLAYMLGQHSQIFCGPETNLFTQPEWIRNWSFSELSIHKSYLNNVMSKGWHIHKGVQFPELLDDENVIQIIAQSKDYQSFIHYIYNYINAFSGKKYIVEKTPSNAIYFHLLRNEFKNTQFVLTIRNPIDAIVSMKKRGWSLVYSCGLYLFNIAMGYDLDHHIEVVKYEDLVNDPQRLLSCLLEEVDLDFEQEMIINLDEMELLPTWEAHVSKHNTSEIRKLDIESRGIEYFIDNLCFKEGFEFYGKKPTFRNIREIMNHFDYSLDIREQGNLRRIKAYCSYTSEYAKRKIKNYPLSGKSFPFIIE